MYYNDSDYYDMTDEEQDALYEYPDDDVRILQDEIQEKIEYITESVSRFLENHPNSLKQANRLNETLYNMIEELDEEIEELSSWRE